MARKTHREAPEMAAFLRRMARAMARRAAEGDLEALSAMADARRAIDAAMLDAARGAHAFGYSWGDIARELGVTRQAAQKRFAQDNGQDGESA